MIQEIKMPSAGQTTDEATVVKVNVKVGDTVKQIGRASCRERV